MWVIPTHLTLVGGTPCQENRLLTTNKHLVCVLAFFKMMYSKNFAAAIIVNGKVLREFGDAVYLPFGSEYKIRLKNLGATRAKVKVEIDGECVTDGGIVIGSRQTLDLERFIRNGNLNQGNCFKFIERTAKIEDHRGAKVDDGIISISYEFEVNPSISHYEVNERYKYSSYGDFSPIAEGITRGGAWGGTHIVPSTNCSPLASVNDTGITVGGSLSNQSFSTTYWGGTSGMVNVMNIHLLGETEDNAIIRKPVTVNTKAKCKTCGTINKAKAKFCGECGTSLQIVPI